MNIIFVAAFFQLFNISKFFIYFIEREEKEKIEKQLQQKTQVREKAEVKKDILEHFEQIHRKTPVPESLF